MNQAMMPIYLHGNVTVVNEAEKVTELAAIHRPRVVGGTPTLAQAIILGHNTVGGTLPAAGQVVGETPALGRAKAKEKARARTPRAARLRSDKAAKDILQGHSALKA